MQEIVIMAKCFTEYDLRIEPCAYKTHSKPIWKRMSARAGLPSPQGAADQGVVTGPDLLLFLFLKQPSTPNRGGSASLEGKYPAIRPLTQFPKHFADRNPHMHLKPQSG